MKKLIPLISLVLLLAACQPQPKIRLKAPEPATANKEVVVNKADTIQPDSSKLAVKD
ncbi:MAG: lipoprotein [Bacteroidota bacterium]